MFGKSEKHGDLATGQLSPTHMSDDKHSPLEDAYHPETDDHHLLLAGGQSPGVRRMEAINTHMTKVERWVLFLTVFIVSYVFTLDGTLRYTYQTYATASYSEHSLLSAVTVIRSVIGAAAQPTAAKIADVFGRAELVLVSIVFYCVGTAVESTAKNVQSFAAGAVLYQVGYSMILLLVEVIIADLTPLRARLFFSFIPALPYVINTWIGGNITAAVLGKTTWNWGIGMFGIIYPICCIPLVFCLYSAQARAKRAGVLENTSTPFQLLGAKRLAIAMFWQLDVIGIILLIAVFGLILTPFTLAGGAKEIWGEGKIIAPLVIGILCIPVWIIWELKAVYPMIPWKLLKDRGVWAGFGIACTLNFSWYMQGIYLYPILYVAVNQSITSATRITSLYTFCSVLTGTGLGMIVYYVRRLKYFIVFGTCLWIVAFGLLIRFRSGTSSLSGIIGAEVVLGIAGGMFSYPTQASVQAETKHEHVAVVTGLYLATYYIGSALGGAVSGAIWTQILPGQLTTRMGNETAALAVYANPYGVQALYPWGTPEREAIVGAYQYVQRILCCAGLGLGVLLILWGICLRDRKLGDEQSRPEAEEDL